MLETITALILNFASSIGYIGIILLMFLESSFFPFPSEVVMIPAGYLAYKGQMNLWIAILCGILGSILGAIFNYFIGYYLGRSFILKFGKYFFLRPESFLKVEKAFNNHGEIITFIGRLLPGVRQYISFPPGITRMNLLKFSAFTTLGASIWVCILAFLGYFIGANQELIKLYLNKIIYSLIAFSALLIVVYILWRRNK